jgi:hypothetical protein
MCLKNHSGGIMKRLFAALAATLIAAPAYAADPVKVIVPFAAGGPMRSRAFSRQSLRLGCKPKSWWRTSVVPAA